ncbi:MAG: hypothetical protein GC164_12045 [Phycisphaera sp.]|nr:hypothetical protein [Phycisphaera sp.]
MLRLIRGGQWRRMVRALTPNLKHTITGNMEAATTTLVAVLLLGLFACNSKPRLDERPGAAPPPPTYTGPAFLHGTVGSLCTVRGADPLLVGGFGVVANLPGSGSSEVPSFLRQRLLNEARLKGWGNVTLGTQNTSPAAFLSSPNTAVVAVEGLIPPGATRGTPFDVLVTAVDTQTTSLEGGDLYTVELGVGGTLPSVRFVRQQAVARGQTYLSPFNDQGNPTDEARHEYARTVVVLSGGTVTNDRHLELILNQPSWRMSATIANRINERFPRAPSDRDDTAVAKTDLVIDLNIPSRYRANPGLLVDLITHLYLQREGDFVPDQALRLGELLESEPTYAPRVVMAWRALGKNATPVVAKYYKNENMTVRLAALEAGAGLGDEAATIDLAQLATNNDTEIRQRVATILAMLPSSIRGSTTLVSLLDDPERSVRIAAYESLTAIGDPAVQHTPILADGQLKFNLDLVPSRWPMVYISQTHRPRIVIFSKDVGFQQPLLASVWDGRLRLRSDSDKTPVQVFYQPHTGAEPRVLNMAPTIGNLVFLLAHKPSVDNPTDGFDLSYSQVVSALFALSSDKQLLAPIHFEPNPLASVVVQMREEPTLQIRPESEQDQPTPVTPEQPAPEE